MEAFFAFGFGTKGVYMSEHGVRRSLSLGVVVWDQEGAHVRRSVRVGLFGCFGRESGRATTLAPTRAGHPLWGLPPPQGVCGVCPQPLLQLDWPVGLPRHPRRPPKPFWLIWGCSMFGHKAVACGPADQTHGP